MRLSEALGIERTDAVDWFDPHLTADTKHYIHPCLLLEAGGSWPMSHTNIHRRMELID